MTLAKRFLWGTVTAGGSVLIKVALNILLIPTFIAHLGVAAYGLYVLLITIVDLSGFLDIGSVTAMITLLPGKDGVENQVYRRELLGTVHGFFLVMALGVVLLSSVISPGLRVLFHVPPALHDLAGVVFTLALVEGGLMLYGFYYRAVALSHNLHYRIYLLESVMSVLSLGICVLLVMQGYGLVAVMVVRMGAVVVQNLILMRVAFCTDPLSWLPGVTLRMKRLKEVFSVSSKAFLVDFSVLVSHRLDNFVIAAFLPLEAVAAYEIVFRFLGIASQICNKIAEGLLPLFSRMHRDNTQADQQAVFLGMSRFLSLTFGTVLIPVVVCFATLFDWFSDGKLDLQQTLPVLYAAIPVAWSGVLQSPAHKYLFAGSQRKFVTVTSLLAAAANFLLSVTLIQVWGILGVALGTLIPQLIQHQAGLIRRACQCLKIPFRYYLTTVHLRLIPVFFAVYLWVLLLHWQMADRWSAPVFFALVGVTSAGLGGVLWFLLAAGADEKHLLRQFFGQLRQAGRSILGGNRKNPTGEGG